MPGHSGAWEGEMLLAVHPWTSPPTSLGLSACSCSPLPRSWGAEPSRQAPAVMEEAWGDISQRPPTKAVLRPGQTPAQAVGRGRDPPNCRAGARGQHLLGWGQSGSAGSLVPTVSPFHTSTREHKCAQTEPEHLLPPQELPGATCT